jgi:hypothetical protein
MGLDDRQEFPRPFEQRSMTGTRAWIDDDDSGARGWREPQYLAKIAIEGDQGSAFSNRGVKHLFIRCAVELLLADRCDLVPLRRGTAPRRCGSDSRQA